MRHVSALWGNVKGSKTHPPVTIAPDSQDLAEIENDQVLHLNRQGINDAVQPTISTIVKSILGNNHESYLIEDTANISETVLSSWTVLPFNEQVGEFKAVVMVRNKALNTIITLMNILSFDYSDAVKVVQQNPMLTDANITLTVGVDAGTSKLYATVAGMTTDNKRIHLCFERCVLGQRFTDLTATYEMVLGMAATLTSYFNMTANVGFNLGMSAQISMYKQISEAFEFSLSMSASPSVYRQLYANFGMNLNMSAVLDLYYKSENLTLPLLFPDPVAIVNEEMNAFIDGTAITITAIDTVNHIITLSWLPKYAIETPTIGKEWIVGIGSEVLPEYAEPDLYGQDSAYLKITSGNRATKTLTYDPTVIRKTELFTVGARVYFYNIYNSGLDVNAGRSGVLIPSVAGTYYSIMTGTGAVWKHSDGTYRMALNGNDGTQWQVGLWSSTNLLDWTFISSTPLISKSGIDDWRRDGLQISCILPLGGGFIGYCWGMVGGYNNIGWVKFDENMQNVSFSSDKILNYPAVPYGFYNANVIYYNGEFKMLVSARLSWDYELEATPWEVWECYSPTFEGPFTKRAAILNTTNASIRNLHTCYRSSHSTAFSQFLLNGKLCAWIDGTSLWNYASNRGERQFGLMYYDDADSTWKDLNIGIIAATYQYANLIWNVPRGHLGGIPTMIKKDGKLYVYLATTQVSDSYQTIVFRKEISSESMIQLPQEIDVPVGVSIATNSPTVSGALSLPAANTTLLTNAISVYELDEVSGTTIADSVGSNNGTVQAGLAINQVGLIGRCIQTDPSTRAGYITVPHNANLNPHNGNFSINVWIKYTGGSLASQISGVLYKGIDYTAAGEYMLVLRGGGSAVYNRGFYFRLRNWSFTNDIGPSTDKTSIVGNGAWHMITLTIDMAAATKALCYLDAVQVGSLAAIQFDMNSTGGMEIGRYTATYPMLGFIDQPAFWKKCLTPTEITSLFNSGAGLARANW